MILFLGMDTMCQSGLCSQIDPAKRGNFSPSSSLICSGETFTLTNNEPAAQNIRYYLGYSGQTEAELSTLPFTLSTTLSLPVNNEKDENFTILQVATRAGQITYACQSILFKASNIPEISTEACNSNFLKITIPKNEKNKSTTYAIDWGDGQKEELVSTLPIEVIRNYSTSSPTRNISVRSTDTALECAVPKRKTVDMTGNTNHPTLDILEITEGGKEAVIELKGMPVEYQLYARKGNANYNTASEPEAKLNPGKHTISIDPTQPTCFMAYRTFGCSVVSGEVCTVIQEDIDILNDDSNILNWTVPVKNAAKDVYMTDSRVTKYTTTILQFDKNGDVTEIPLSEANTYKDVINCIEEYCYQIKIEVEGLTSGSKRIPYTSTTFSEKKCAKRSEEVLPMIDDLLVTVDAQKVKLVWDLSPEAKSKVESFQINRLKVGGVESVKIAKDEKAWIDEIAQPDSKSYCYTMTYEDKCKRKSAPTDNVCTIYLQVDERDVLTWTPESPSVSQIDITSYEVLYIDENTSEVVEKSLPSTTYTHPPALEQDNEMKEVVYWVQAVRADGKQSRSNEVRIPLRIQVFMPDIFTPNSDGNNEELEIKGKRIKTADIFEFQVYNRWGELVYRTSNPGDKWRGETLSAGNYTYYLHIAQKNGQKIERRGTISLVR